MIRIPNSPVETWPHQTSSHPAPFFLPFPGIPFFNRFLSFFSRKFGTKCAGCAQGISPSDLVRKARSKVFHLNCFTCMVCNKQLSTGEELYIIDENKFVCKEDYLSSTSLKEGSLNSGERAGAGAIPSFPPLPASLALPLGSNPSRRIDNLNLQLGHVSFFSLLGVGTEHLNDR